MVVHSLKIYAIKNLSRKFVLDDRIPYDLHEFVKDYYKFFKLKKIKINKLTYNPIYFITKFEKNKDDLLELCAYYGLFEIVKYICQFIVKLDKYKALDNAITMNHTEIFYYLEEKMNITPNCDTFKLITYNKDYPRIFRYLIEKYKIDLNINMNIGIISDAIETGNLEVVKYLMEDCKVIPSAYMVYHAVCYKHIDIVKYLYSQHGLNNFNNDAFIHAIDLPDPTILIYMLENTVEITPDSMLLFSVKSSDLETVKYFVEKYNLQLTNTVLSYAVKRGFTDIIEYFTEYYNIVPDKYMLEYAIRFNHFDLVKHMIEHYHLDPNHKEIFKCAAHKGNVEIIQYLIEEVKIKLNKKIALHAAAESGNLNIVKYLVEKCGVHPNNKDALTLAERNNKYDITEYLKSFDKN